MAGVQNCNNRLVGKCSRSILDNIFIFQHDVQIMYHNYFYANSGTIAQEKSTSNIEPIKKYFTVKLHNIILN